MKSVKTNIENAQAQHPSAESLDDLHGLLDELAVAREHAALEIEVLLEPSAGGLLPLLSAT